MSSKTARLRRRQAANLKKYARLRKAGTVPQHTQAQRRLAAAERERQRVADQRRDVRLRLASLPVAATVSAAAASFVFGAAATNETGHVHRPLYPAVRQAYPFVPFDTDHPDPPHVPELEMTDYPVYYAAGTATAAMHAGSESWDAYAYAQMHGLYLDD